MKSVLFLCLLAVQTCLIASDAQVHNNPQILACVRNELPNYGYLRKENNGFVYLQVSRDFVTRLFPLLNVPAAVEPPYFGPNGVGAHISVIRKFEVKDARALRIAGLGKKVFFEVTNLCSAVPRDWPGCKKVWFLQVKCPELEKLRMQHGFSPKISGHEFHLTIAIEK